MHTSVADVYSFGNKKKKRRYRLNKKKKKEKELAYIDFGLVLKKR